MSKNKRANNLIELFFKSERIDAFFFSMLCATVFTMMACHWVLDINYRYENIKQKGFVIDFRVFFFIEVIIVFFYILKSRWIKFDWALLFLLQGMILAGIIDYNYQDYIPVCYAWILPMAYIIGKKVILTNPSNIKYRSMALLLVLMLGGGISALIDYANRYIVGTDAINKWPTFMTGEDIARTTYDYGFVFIIALVGICVVDGLNKKLVIFVVSTLNMIVQMLAFATQGREPTCILLVNVFIIALIIINNKHKDKWWFFLSCALIIIYAVTIILLFVYFTDFGGIVEKYMNSYWADGGGLVRNQRIKLNVDALKNILKYPLEDFQARYGFPRSHSMMLEYGRRYDLTVYVLLSVFRFITIKDAFVYLKKSKSRTWMSCVVFPLAITLNVYYSLEPNGFALRYFWMPGLFVSGIIRGHLEFENEL